MPFTASASKDPAACDLAFAGAQMEIAIGTASEVERPSVTRDVTLSKMAAHSAEVKALVVYPAEVRSSLMSSFAVLTLTQVIILRGVDSSTGGGALALRWHLGRPLRWSRIVNVGLRRDAAQDGGMGLLPDDPRLDERADDLPRRTPVGDDA